MIVQPIPLIPPISAYRPRTRMTNIETDGDEALTTVMREVSLSLQADALVVAWHDGEAEPMLLFAEGDKIEDLVEHAHPGPLHGGDEAVSEWRITDVGTPGGCMTTSIPAGRGVVTITSLFHRIGDTTRARVRDAASRFLPLVQPFLRLWSARLSALSQVRGLTAAVNKSDVGIFLVNREGQLIFANATGDLLIAEMDGLRRSGPMLSATRLSDTLRLHAAIEHVGAGSGPAAPVVALHRKSRRPLLAAVVASETALDHAQDSAAIVYVFDPERDLSPLVEPACKFYGLSPVETRLTCLLADGISLVDAATRMRLREQTARSYLKQIFLKTDTNRQAELVWLMLKSSVRTAPGCRASLI